MPVISLKVGITPQRILVRNPDRVVFSILNYSSYDVYVGYDKNVSTTGKTKGILVKANGGGMEDEYHKGEVWAIATAETEITVVEVSRGE
ncbi:MAG: hypothetical protein DRN92_03135 [Thermoproteota archaeon]|nr:MAG: hypothetical protein DRN92_03135 [Candidatus Korarchaeota archaeon]